MSVSVLNSYTVSTRQALSNSLEDSALSATKMATGEGIQHAYEDPTGLAIGSSMRGDLDILKIVYTGIKQTQSMLYIAEEGMKAIHGTMSKLNQVLAKAKLGYMTDALVNSTLSPTYQQLKAEINRIADSIDFNGQKLLNATGGKRTAATVSTVGSATYTFANNSAATLSGVTGFGLTAFVPTFTGAATAPVAATYPGATYTVSGGTITQNGADVMITGATLVIGGVTLTDTALVSGTADLTITGVNITMTTPTYNATTKVLSDSSSVTIDVSTTTTADYSFSNLSSTISGWTQGTHTAATAVTTGTATASVSNVARTYALSGGSSATSTFNFVTGSDLNEAIVEVSFPNLRLTANNGINGLIETINTSENISSTVPLDLTDLTTINDADTDIPLVQTLADKLIEYIDALGAYQTRLMNIEAQLATSVAQVDLAQGAIMNADLAEQSELFTRSNVKINVAIAVLGQMNASLKALERLVQ